jgi:hypothetical protein
MKTTLKNLKMKPNGRNEEVLEHAVKIGYVNRLSNKSLFITAPFLFFYKGDNIKWDNNLTQFNDHPHPEISVDDFLKLGTRFKTEQEFIEEFGEEWISKTKYHWYYPYMNHLFGKEYERADIKGLMISSDMLTTEPLPASEKKEEKRDAFIDSFVTGKTGEQYRVYVYSEDEQQYSAICGVKHAHLYNILSKEDYQRKHPLPEKKLMFKDWIVTPQKNVIHIGCDNTSFPIRFTKEDVKSFWAIALTAEENGVNLHELYVWIDNHQKELGL